MAKKNLKHAAKTESGDDAERVVCENRRARHEYEILETLECGMVLVGSEVRSLREGNVSLDDAYARVKLPQEKVPMISLDAMKKIRRPPLSSARPIAAKTAVAGSAGKRGTGKTTPGKNIASAKAGGKSKDRRAAERGERSGRNLTALSQDGELWLLGCDIAEYTEANLFNHKPKRDRKLLLHRREIRRFAARAFEKGLTLVPLRILFRRGKAKVLIGLCRGKQLHDKRDAKKKADNDRYLARFMMKRR